MKSSIFALLGFLLLSGCTSPLANMSHDQVAQLSDDQICSFYRSYSFEEKTALEVGKRRLNCDPNVRACMANGYKDGTAEMALCVNNRIEKAQLQQQIEDQNRIIQNQQNQMIIQNSINRNNPNLYQNNSPIVQQCPGFPFCR